MDDKNTLEKTEYNKHIHKKTYCTKEIASDIKQCRRVVIKRHVSRWPAKKDPGITYKAQDTNKTLATLTYQSAHLQGAGRELWRCWRHT